MDECANYEYRDHINYSCQPCHLTCKACVGGNIDQCINCLDANHFDFVKKYLSDSYGQCKKNTCLSDQYVADDNYTCRDCHSSCLRCVGSSYNKCN